MAAFVTCVSCLRLGLDCADRLHRRRDPAADGAFDAWLRYTLGEVNAGNAIATEPVAPDRPVTGAAGH